MHYIAEPLLRNWIHLPPYAVGDTDPQLIKTVIFILKDSWLAAKSIEFSN